MKWLSISLLLLPLLVFAEQTAVLVIKTDPAKADIFVNGEFKADTSPLIIEVPAGTYEVKAKQGDKTAKTSIKLTAGATVIGELKLVAPSVTDLSDGKVFRDTLADGSPCDFCPQMVWIPTGSFMMGSDTGTSDEQPVHKVKLTNRFAMGIYEITFEEYDYFAKTTGRPLPSDGNWGRGNRPVINVSWSDATAYATWLSSKTGHTYRLPTEAEWEYAARAGTTTNYWWGDAMQTKGAKGANCDSDNNKTVSVGSFKANAFGLYDTVGNVWEWTCSDYDAKAYETSSTHLQCSQQPNRRKVSRGGSWYSGADYCRVTYRQTQFSASNNAYGFRVILMP
ncbi:SUMF1/EgtB/PvdO family nonheme iron enzyme [Beggiatoa leptomitoformis]|uniref:SUMF1/EgtB/PvdO family nonheme iron enzyme n=1 Tax=Beggiatoa leptomitoformis TaxID=288004 RepID=A0A2N9YJ87_9GAMM|nr:formylglycine-generating enzyme family protein [Beggiatoa leptomitoformis]ALG69538.2 SUMF1/EgtB/PvdO family nonheme iron enzyme [Beggiatoa leptomitoformis]AUI70570.2 SUMF1/EgtB/PvdO family nonheme iron enzyme [Beggiatoa leptomitoformis]